LHAPVGLDLGADSPEQVALAIVAEMQAVLTNRDARFLRERDRPIHG
jgi:xanthine/CO dehydrogenase XdhC/CoxF family maturation factor